MTIIALAGQMRAGKDSAARVLVEDYGFTRLAFADRLKELALQMDPLFTSRLGHTRELSFWVTIGGWERTKNDIPGVRAFLQDFGQLVKDEFDSTYWARYVFDQIKARPERDYVLTDTRFPHEIQGARDLGGYYVVVERPGLPDTDTHQSEWAWREVPADYILDNSATLRDLTGSVAAMMSRLEPRG